MTEDIKPETIKQTQNLLTKFIKKPPLTDKLLKKPPFRFLHDIVTSVMRETGFMDGLFMPEELNPDNVKDRESKMIFLEKLISAVKQSTGIALNVRPSKIVAGLEVNKTHELLQAIAKALEIQVNNKNTVDQVSKKGTKKPSSVVRSNKHDSSKPKANESNSKADSSPLNREKDIVSTKDTTKGVGKNSENKIHENRISDERTESEGPKTINVEKGQRKPSRVSKETKKLKPEKIANPEVGSVAKKRDSLHGTKSKTTKDMLENITKENDDNCTPEVKGLIISKSSVTSDLHENGFAAEKERPSVGARDVSEEVILKPINENRKRSVTQLEEVKGELNPDERAAGETDVNGITGPVVIKSDTNETNVHGSHAKGSEDISNQNAPSEYKAANRSSEIVKSENVKRPQSARRAHRKSSGRSDLSKDSHAVEILDSEINKKTVPGFEPMHPELSPSTAQLKQQNSIGPKEVVVTCPMSARPITARPRSARPGAPRIRDRPETVTTEPLMAPSSVNVITDADPDHNNDLDDAENTVVMMSQQQGPQFTESLESAEDVPQGQLVAQILETQRELEEPITSQTTRKVEIEWEGGRKQEREAAEREVEKLRHAVQTLTRAANPLGKLVDFLQEDVDSMQRELATWRATNDRLSGELKAERSLSEESVAPLKQQLIDVELAILEQLEQLAAVKAVVISNDERVDKLITASK